jgi:hypothetical protein
LTQKYDELQQYRRNFCKDEHTLEITAIMRKRLTVTHKSADMLSFWKWFARRSTVERSEAFGEQDEIEIISPSNFEYLIDFDEKYFCPVWMNRNTVIWENEKFDKASDGWVANGKSARFRTQIWIRKPKYLDSAAVSEVDVENKDGKRRSMINHPLSLSLVTEYPMDITVNAFRRTGMRIFRSDRDKTWNSRNFLICRNILCILPESVFEEVPSRQANDVSRSSHRKKFRYSSVRLFQRLHRIVSVQIPPELVSIRLHSPFSRCEFSSLSDPASEYFWYLVKSGFKDISMSEIDFKLRTSFWFDTLGKKQFDRGVEKSFPLLAISSGYEARRRESSDSLWSLMLTDRYWETPAEKSGIAGTIKYRHSKYGHSADLHQTLLSL